MAELACDKRKFIIDHVSFFCRRWNKFIHLPAKFLAFASGGLWGDYSKPSRFHGRRIVPRLGSNMNFEDSDLVVPERFRRINEYYRRDEASVVRGLLSQISIDTNARSNAQQRARSLVETMRKTASKHIALDTLLAEYKLSTREGMALMCLAEALLRVPDRRNADRLIRDKIAKADWSTHVGTSQSLLVSATSLALLMAGRVVDRSGDNAETLGATVRSMMGQLGSPVVRAAMYRAMQLIGKQFIAGQTIEQALNRTESGVGALYRFSYDMLGEAARTERDAERYFDHYDHAIAAINRLARGNDLHARPGISVKLSALHPRYEVAQRERVLDQLTDRLFKLAQHAAEANIGLTVDAEEAERLELSLEVIERVFARPELGRWEGFGLVVQTYSKRAIAVLDFLASLSAEVGRRLQVRLVKGGYWDAEIKAAQVKGLDGYPVFTRKMSTDVSYLACAQKLLALRDKFYPMFATHNALTLATIVELAGDRNGFEFQKLHGMGQALYDQIIPPAPTGVGIPCRVYAPVGNHDELLPYLVRRLLENGASTSFVNRMVDPNVSIEELIMDPIDALKGLTPITHPKIPVPGEMFGLGRKNSNGPDLTDRAVLVELSRKMQAALTQKWTSAPIVAGQVMTGATRPVIDPSNGSRIVGTVVEAGADMVDKALESAVAAQVLWDQTPVFERTACLRRAADLLEERTPELMAMLVREAGKTIPDTIAEIREAVDFCRYYAEEAEVKLGRPIELPGPTGERNQLTYHGRGVFVCISPWNFPLAIFLGQVCAALVTGNAVIAKPAEQTPLIGATAVRILYEAGVPREILQFMPGQGEIIGAKLCQDARIAGVAFTGSTETAKTINRTISESEGPIPRLIAETGGQNALIADSSALPEQVVRDVVRSAFHTAGQRCSALRLLFLQSEIADRVIEMLIGAMKELTIGQPGDLSTDVGPVIDREALDKLESHFAKMNESATLLFRCEPERHREVGYFFPPCAFEITKDQIPAREVFGPIVHVLRYNRTELDTIVDTINSTGYGLTLGVHSRIEETVQQVRRRARVGNMYVNRDIIGAQVGVQPFGGERLSGTGPKAGGPNYLFRFCTERSFAEDTTAAGGNATLVTLDEKDGIV